MSLLETTNTAKSIWANYLEGEEDISEPPNSISQRLSTTIRDTLAFATFDIDNSSKGKEWRSTSFDNRVSSTLHQMSLDPSITARLAFLALRAGADPTYCTSSQEDLLTALHNVSWNRSFKALSVLLCDPSTQSILRDAKGNTPLILASTYNAANNSSSAQLATLQILLARRDLRINLRNNLGYTALVCAWRAESYMVVRELLLFGASVLVTLPIYAAKIPLLKLLVSTLYSEKDLLNFEFELSSPNISAVRANSSLSSLISMTELSPAMFDYSESSFKMQCYRWRYGTEQLLQGMILFRVREELRALKAPENDLLSHKEDSRANQGNDQALYLSKLQSREAARTERKKKHSEKITLRREKEQMDFWDKKRQANSAKLAKQFNIEIKGLSVM